MKKITPYLMFNGTCEAALTFYKDALEGEIAFMQTFRDSPLDIDESNKDKIMHATFNFEGGSFMASDHLEGAGFTTDASGSAVHLSLGFSDINELKATFARLEKGGKVTMALQKTFWGDTFGMLADQYGVHWMFSGREEKKE